MKLEITWQDVEGLKKFRRQVDRLNVEFPKVMPRILNQVGDRAKTRVIRALIKQTGLEREVIVKAVKQTRSFSGKLHYDLRTRGGNVRLRYLQPVETEEGVTANAFGKRQLYVSAFMRAGWWPNRVESEELGGHVWRRVGSGWGRRMDGSKGRKITHARSGVFIPKEMVEGMAKAAFEEEANKTLPKRVEAAVQKLLK